MIHDGRELENFQCKNPSYCLGGREQTKEERAHVRRSKISYFQVDTSPGRCKIRASPAVLARRGMFEEEYGICCRVVFGWKDAGS